MERALNVITLEIRKKRFINSLIKSLLGCICIFSLGVLCIKSSISGIPEMMIHVTAYILLVVYSFSLTQEFENKTDKMIFTGIFTRNEIIISKLISFMFSSVICFIFYEITSIICSTFDSNMLLPNLSAFIIYGFTLGSFVLMVSVISSNFLVTGIITYILYFDLMHALLSQALLSTRNETMKWIIVRLPFYIANSGLNIGKYTINQSIIMVCCGVIFLVAACGIMNRKSM